MTVKMHWNGQGKNFEFLGSATIPASEESHENHSQDPK